MRDISDTKYLTFPYEEKTASTIEVTDHKIVTSDYDLMQVVFGMRDIKIL